MIRVAEENRDSQPAVQRLDKWLWYARLVRSRTLSASMIEAGKVRLNRARVRKSSQSVKIGDVITALIARRVRVVKVLATGTRRGPAMEALCLYEDLSPEGVARTSYGGYGEAKGRAGRNSDRGNVVSAFGLRPRGAGRPTKRDRRLLERFKGGVD